MNRSRNLSVRLSRMPSTGSSRRQPEPFSENSARRLIIVDGLADEVGFARGGGRIGEAVRGDYAEEVTPICEDFGVLEEGVLGQLRLQQFPVALVLGAEVERVDETVIVGIVGLPGDEELGVAAAVD